MSDLKDNNNAENINGAGQGAPFDEPYYKQNDDGSITTPPENEKGCIESQYITVAQFVEKREIHKKFIQSLENKPASRWIERLWKRDERVHKAAEDLLESVRDAKEHLQNLEKSFPEPREVHSVFHVNDTDENKSDKIISRIRGFLVVLSAAYVIGTVVTFFMPDDEKKENAALKEENAKLKAKNTELVIAVKTADEAIENMSSKNTDVVTGQMLTIDGQKQQISLLNSENNKLTEMVDSFNLALLSEKAKSAGLEYKMHEDSVSKAELVQKYNNTAAVSKMLDDVILEQLDNVSVLNKNLAAYKDTIKTLTDGNQDRRDLRMLKKGILSLDKK